MQIGVIVLAAFLSFHISHSLGIVLGTLYAGGYLMSKNELSAGNLMSFMVATQTVQRYTMPNNF